MEENKLTEEKVEKTLNDLNITNLDDTNVNLDSEDKLLLHKTSKASINENIDDNLPNKNDTNKPTIKDEIIDDEKIQDDLVLSAEAQLSELSLNDKKIRDESKKIDDEGSEDEYYDLSSDASNVETEDNISFSESQKVNEKSGDERERGDGEESNDVNVAENLDDDEDKSNPQYIPKRGAFYEHDDRVLFEDTESLKQDSVQDKCEKQVLKSELINDQLEQKDVKKKVSKWSHDLFDMNKQNPKSNDELVYTYGYDIRGQDDAPKPRRRNRYGRGPNKYTRSWKDENAYNQFNSRHPERKKRNDKPKIEKNKAESLELNEEKIITEDIEKQNINDTKKIKEKEFKKDEIRSKFPNRRTNTKENKNFSQKDTKEKNTRDNFKESENTSKAEPKPNFKENFENKNSLDKKKNLQVNKRKEDNFRKKDYDDNFRKKDYDDNFRYKDERRRSRNYDNNKLDNERYNRRYDKSDSFDYNKKSNIDKKTFSNDDFPQLSNNEALLKSKNEKFLQDSNTWSKYKNHNGMPQNINFEKKDQKDDKKKNLDKKNYDHFYNNSFNSFSHKDKYDNFKNVPYDNFKMNSNNNRKNLTTYNNQSMVFQDHHNKPKGRDNLRNNRNNNHQNSNDKSIKNKNFFENPKDFNKNISISKPKTKPILQNTEFLKENDCLPNIKTEEKLMEKNQNEVKNLNSENIVDKETAENLQARMKKFQINNTKMSSPFPNLTTQLPSIQSTLINNKLVTPKTHPVLTTNPSIQSSNIITQQLLNTQQLINTQQQNQSHHQQQNQLLNTISQSALPQQHLAATHLPTSMQQQTQQNTNSQTHLNQHHTSQFQQQNAHHQNLNRTQPFFETTRQTQTYYTQENNSPRSSFAYMQHNEDPQLSRYLAHSQIANQFQAATYGNPGVPTPSAAPVVQQDQTSYLPPSFHSHHPQYAAYAPAAPSPYTQYPTQTYQSVPGPQVQSAPGPSEFSRGGVTYYDPRLQYINNNLARQIPSRKRQSNALPIIAPDAILQQQYN